MNLEARVCSALSALAVLLGAENASAQTFDYCNFSNVGTLTLNGSAARAGSLLQLTTNANDLAASAYRTAVIPWTLATSFHTSFQFQIEPNTAGADGLSFILQNQGKNALGGVGGELGYGGIHASVEVEFDTFQNTWDPNSNHVGVMQNGDNTDHIASAEPPFTMAGGGVLYAWIDYNATTTELDVYLTQTATKPAMPLLMVDLDISTTVGAKAYAGFTAATGGSTNEHDILDWQFSTKGEPCFCGGDAACSGATPVCAPPTDPQSGLCVQCVADSDCDANLNTSTPICNKTGSNSDMCRACASSSECISPLEPICQKGSPFLGQCVMCLSNVDCLNNPLGPVCFNDGATFECVECTSDANCTGATPVCDTTTHRCEPCASDADCKDPTPACQTSGTLTGECTQCSGTNETECAGSTPVCDPASGTCVGCDTDADCAGSSPICNVTTHACRPCQSNTDCMGMGSAHVCATTGMRQGQCVGCLTNADCSPPATCDPATDTCSGCTTNADCAGQTPICNPSTHGCSPCSSDSDCSLPTPACETTGACGQCSRTNTSQCVPGGATPTCVIAEGTCGCTGNSVCGEGKICDPEAPPLGQCVSESPPDAGLVDAGLVDASPAEASALDGGGTFDGAIVEAGEADGKSPVQPDGASTPFGATGQVTGGGCSCSTGSSPKETPTHAAFGMLLAGVAILSRKRGRRPRGCVKAR